MGHYQIIGFRGLGSRILDLGLGFTVLDLGSLLQGLGSYVSGPGLGDGDFGSQVRG